MDVQRKLNRPEADNLIEHLHKLDAALGKKPTEYQYIDGNVGDWRMLPNGETCFYCPAYYGYKEKS